MELPHERRRLPFIVMTLVVAAAAAAAADESNYFSYTSITKGAGILFERMGGVRHYVPEERYTFVRKLNFLPLVQNLHDLKSGINTYQRNYTITCGHPVGLFNYKKADILRGRINKLLKSITPLNKDYVSYTWDDGDNNTLSNDVFDSLDMEFDYADSRELKTMRTAAAAAAATAAADRLRHWSELSANEANALMRRSTSEKNVAILPQFDTINVTEKYSEYTRCLVTNHTKHNNCMFAESMMKLMLKKIDDIVAQVKVLERIVKQVNRNKLNASNTIMDDDTLLAAMNTSASALHARGLAWAVDLSRPRSDSFDLSAVYKLHLYADKDYSIALFVLMPLLRNITTVYNLYRFVTLPFCVKQRCLLVIPTNEYAVISASKNYYMAMDGDTVQRTCTQFNSAADDDGDEYLCLERRDAPPVATMNSNVCEIEMYMGRRIDDMDTLCDVRMASVDRNSAHVCTVVESNKWLYVADTDAATTINFLCTAANGTVAGALTASRGLGVVSRLQPHTCTLRMNSGIVAVAASRRHATTTYWPRKRVFNFNDYINASLLSGVYIKSLPTLDNFTRVALLSLKTKFNVKNYTIAPIRFFAPSKIYTLNASGKNGGDGGDGGGGNNNRNFVIIDKEKTNTHSFVLTIIIVVSVLSLVLVIFVIFFYRGGVRNVCCRQTNNAVVKYCHQNNDAQPIVTVYSGAAAASAVEFDHDNFTYLRRSRERDALLSNNNNTPSLYPMIIKQIK
uniref:DekiORF128 n=1 Tax=Dendrolimus kikuchii nucleopolyhedrovirus TaxID=1219875 RepID=V9LT11_9ABAC|nr:DekiORF128 [Dendrolimus kikuchii nucleopolyhedrovirus]